MKIVVMGAGGVGGYFGGRLAQAGHEVWFVARGAHLEALQQQGLHVASIAGDFTVAPARASSDPAAAGRADAVLVAVKSWQTQEAARALAPVVGAGTVVVSLQNGATAAEEIGAVLGLGPVLGGVCRIMAFLAGPGRITHAAIDPTVLVGELDGSKSARVEALVGAFRDCQGARAIVSDDIRRDIWTKFLFIAAVSGVGAACRVPLDELREVPESRRLLELAMREVEAVARARGVVLAADVVPRTLSFVDALPAGSTASMQRDVVDGRPSELEAQNGAVVRLGRQLGVATPAHELLCAVLRPQELEARRRSVAPAPAAPEGTR